MGQLGNTMVTGRLAVTGNITAPILYGQAQYIRDSGNGNNISVAYSSSGLTSTTWLAAWNDYELRAISPSNVTVGKATSDASGNVITSTYATKTELTNALKGYVANSTLDGLDYSASGLGVGKTITALTQTNGAISVTAGNISITKSQISDFPASLPASDVKSWAKADNKPSYAFSEITGTMSDSQLNAAINKLSTGTSVPSDNDYYVSQYVGGGTTTTSFHRRPVSKLYDYIKSKTDSLYLGKTASASKAEKVVIESKKYVNVIGTANNTTGASFYFAQILPDNADISWHIKYKITGVIPNSNTVNSFSIVDFFGSGTTRTVYSCFNSHRTSNKAFTYHNLVSPTSGYITTHGTLLGVGIRNAYSPTNSTYARHFTVEIIEADNCSVKMLDDMYPLANVPNYSTTYWNGFAEYNGYSNGLMEYGDDNTVSQLRLDNTSVVVKPGYNLVNSSLIMFDKDGYASSIVLEDGLPATNTQKTSRYDVGFDPTRIKYYNGVFINNKGGTANIKSSNYNVYSAASTLDLRYSSRNPASGQYLFDNPGKPIYLVGKIQSDGLFYLDSTQWLSQTLPTTNDYCVYIYLGLALHSDNSTNYMTLESYHPIYKWNSTYNAYVVSTMQSNYADSASYATNASYSTQSYYATRAVSDVAGNDITSTYRTISDSYTKTECDDKFISYPNMRHIQTSFYSYVRNQSASLSAFEYSSYAYMPILEFDVSNIIDSQQIIGVKGTSNESVIDIQFKPTFDATGNFDRFEVAYNNSKFINDDVIGSDDIAITRFSSTSCRLYYAKEIKNRKSTLNTSAKTNLDIIVYYNNFCAKYADSFTVQTINSNYNDRDGSITASLRGTYNAPIYITDIGPDLYTAKKTSSLHTLLQDIRDTNASTKDSGSIGELQNKLFTIRNLKYLKIIVYTAGWESAPSLRSFNQTEFYVSSDLLNTNNGNVLLCSETTSGSPSITTSSTLSASVDGKVAAVVALTDIFPTNADPDDDPDPIGKTLTMTCYSYNLTYLKRIDIEIYRSNEETITW